MAKKEKYRTDRKQGLDPKDKIGATISYGGYHTWKNFGTLLLVTLTYLAITAIGTILVALSTSKTTESAIKGDTPVEMTTANWLLLAAGGIVLVISSFISMSIQKGFIHTDSEDNVSYGDFFEFNNNVFKGFITSVIASAISIIPFLGYLFYLAMSGTRTEDLGVNIAGIICMALFVILSVYLTYAPYYSLDDGTKPITAIKNSFADVSKYPVYVIGTLVFMTIIYLVSSITIIAVLFTFPMMMVVIANSYRAISQHRVDKAVQDIDRKYAPAVQPAEDQATRDLNQVLGDRNSDNL